MQLAYVDSVDSDDAGFQPSQTLLQTSLTPANVPGANVTTVVTLPDNTLPDGAPAGYIYLDTLVVEALGNAQVEFCPWPATQDKPQAWAGRCVGGGNSIRLIDSGVSATGASLLVRAHGSNQVRIRRGWALKLVA